MTSVNVHSKALAREVEKMPPELRYLTESVAFLLTNTMRGDAGWDESTDDERLIMQAAAASLLWRAHSRARAETSSPRL
ncbi:MAG: hypothetical protein PSX79_02515 [bacterium]|jgi:hypothetical protein|nr:hypothetical protein [bacterium]